MNVGLIIRMAMHIVDWEFCVHVATSALKGPYPASRVPVSPSRSRVPVALHRLAMACRLSYYEGLFPGPRTEMLVTGVSTLTGGGYPVMYLKWQAVQFTVRIKRAKGLWLLKDVLAEIPGCKVIVDIDHFDDTVHIWATQCPESNSPESSAKQKKLEGELGWAIRVPPAPAA